MKRILFFLALAGCGEMHPIYSWSDYCAERADAVADLADACGAADATDRMAECCLAHDCDEGPADPAGAQAILEGCAAHASDPSTYECAVFPSQLPGACTW